MTESLNVTVDRRDGLAVIYTEGYINNQGGEEIARVAYKLLDEGYKALLLNLAGTKIVNSIGISILIEIIEKMIEIGGHLGFCCLTPTIEKTFHIMGLAQYAPDLPRDETRGQMRPESFRDIRRRPRWQRSAWRRPVQDWKELSDPRPRRSQRPPLPPPPARALVGRARRRPPPPFTSRAAASLELEAWEPGSTTFPTRSRPPLLPLTPKVVAILPIPGGALVVVTASAAPPTATGEPLTLLLAATAQELPPEVRAQGAAVPGQLPGVELEALYDVGLAVASTLDFDRLSEEILLRAVSLLDARRGALYILEGGRYRLDRTFGGEAAPWFA